ncbi:class I SAM-dependent methyltransferase [Mesorhizobium sp. CO1-1-8]|uniref:class I SAM-dependent methyltransferase n=1 Tax=Mesorhizobium sp. CO1-1-8 TaxID=2876631 RepID=UPI001CD05A3E|nr:class I SAM-dependent methyltransferase [Mesorhizobium sp. CO1-1-8]MBZ9770988.1 class I SAM-dependent methyltransferase [Mesorhizobium sp. CO1-1-8]
MVSYEKFIADIYDSSPFFGQGKARELEKFNAPYFRHLRDRPKRVLEFGSGTGMLTVPLARAGYRLDSVDISSFMHDVLSRKLQTESEAVRQNVNQIVADATTFSSSEPYQTIVMPEGILIALPSDMLQMALLRSCHRNLAEGGMILIDFFQPYYRVILGETKTDFSRFHTLEGDTYIMRVDFSNDSYTQIQHWHVTYTKIVDGNEVGSTVVDLDFRYVFYSEIKLMLEIVGFRVIELDVEFAEHRGFFLAAQKI